MKNRKGIVLAGGSGTRLYPLTLAISKQIMPVYDKPMIYYPLSILMQSDIREVLIITTPRDIETFKTLLGDGNQWGMKFEYKIQEKPNGLAEAFIIGEDFIGDSNVAMILGDNMFYGEHLSEKLKQANEREEEATIFGYYVKDPERFGVVEFSDEGKVVSIEEKPNHPKSNYAVTGLYFYDNKVIEYAKSLKPSSRNELEITDINQIYLKNNKLHTELLGRGFAWLDTGTHKSLLQAGQFVQTIEENQGIKIACLEEVAYRMGYLDRKTIIQNAQNYNQNEYFNYITNLR